MKFQANISDFQKALVKVLPAMPRKSTLPILEHFMFTLNGNDLQIVATDQELIISTNLQVQGEEDGSILIPGKRITDIFRALADNGTFRFVSDPDNFEVIVLTLLGNYKMKGIDSDEYLDLPVLFNSEKPPIQSFIDSSINDPSSYRILLNSESLNKLAGKTYYAVSEDEFRPAMTGVLFQFRETFVNAVATDSYRLVKSIYKIEESQYPNELDVILPARTTDILRKINENVAMSFINTNKKITHIRFDTVDTIYISRIIDEQFPAYEAVIPKSCKYNAKLNKANTLSAIRRVAIFTSDNTNLVKFSFEQNKLTISGRDDDRGSSATEELVCEFNEESIEIGFNYKFLDQMINSIDSDGDQLNFYLSFTEPNRAVLIKPDKEEEDLVMLIMPIRP